MAKVLIPGAGKIGALISGLLAESGSYAVHLGDVSAAAANAVVGLQDELLNRFGKHYAATGGKEVSAHIVVSGQAGHQRRQ